MSLGQVITVGDFRKMTETLPDDCKLFLTARQRISLDESLDRDTPMPYNFSEAEMSLENINTEKNLVHFEVEIPSPHYYNDN